MEDRAGRPRRRDRAGDHLLPLPARHLPGTSKWNKIEHRLFAQISKNWRARPLTSHEVIVATIAATTTTTGLAVTAALDDRAYPTGVKITAAQVKKLEDTGALTRHGFCGAWNYTLRPAPAASPATTLPPSPLTRPPPRPAVTRPPCPIPR
jgi:hypothetical protein